MSKKYFSIYNFFINIDWVLMKFPDFINGPYILPLIIALVTLLSGTVLLKVLLICILILQKSKSDLYLFKFLNCFSNLSK